MKYALITNNKVVNTIVADAEFIAIIRNEYDHVEPLDTPHEQGLGVGVDWSWDGEFHPPATSEITPTTKITRLAFMNRFTDAEAISIDLASQGATVQAAAMRRYQKKVDAATFVDLDQQDTRDGVISLESIGILVPGRALQILDTPVTQEEVYKGN